MDHVATVNARIGWKALTASEYLEDGYAFLATPNIKGPQIDFDDVNYISAFRFNESPELKLQVGDVLLAKDGSTLGITNVVRQLPKPATVNGSIAVVRPHSVDPRFLMYALLGHETQSWIDQVKDGMGVPHLFQADIRKLRFLAPVDLVEQRRVADFLDDQVARIDNIIAARRLELDLTLELGANERERLLLGRSDPVTKRSKWRPFRQVPESWAETTLRSIPALLQTGPFGSQLHSDQYVDGAWPVVNPANIHDGRITADVTATVDGNTRDRLARHMLRAGDIVFGRRGELGKAALVTDTQEGWLLGTGSLLVRLAPSSPLVAAYLSALLRTAALRYYFESKAVGSTMANLNVSILSAMPVVVPTIPTQQTIVAAVDHSAQMNSEAVGRLEGSIALLGELKRSLISAAVSGEFDVSAADGSQVPIDHPSAVTTGPDALSGTVGVS